MARRICMWIAVVSLVGLGLAGAAASLAARYDAAGAGWTFYTPYAQPPASFASRVASAGGHAQTVLFPIAALSSAGYILALERDVRRGRARRGFDVAPGGGGRSTPT